MATRVKKDKPNAMTEEQINRTSEIITSLFKKCDATLNDKYNKKRICKTLIGQLLLNTNSDKEFHSVLKTSICEYITTSFNKNHYYAPLDLDLDPKTRYLFSTQPSAYVSKSEAKKFSVNNVWTYNHKIAKGKVVVSQGGQSSHTSYERIKQDINSYHLVNESIVQWS